jgi:hypothetical protein
MSCGVTNLGRGASIKEMVMRRFTWLALGVLGLSFTSGLRASDPKIEEQLVGPAAPDATYVVSPRGNHLATAARKGSRMSIVCDGEAGPKFESIITPSLSFVDPRPTFASGQAGATPRPVTFSRDGSRYAYVGKQGAEWILIADGKEVVHIPAGTELRLEFTGDSGKHLLMSSAVFNGFELWVDGQKWPGIYQSGGGGSVGTADPMISPDGTRIAYMAQIARDKRSLIIDGQDAGYSADNLQWSPDGKHLLGISQDKGAMHLLIDGKAVVHARGITRVYLPPVGGRMIMAMVHLDQKTNTQGQFLWVDGKPVETSGCETIKKVIFSPDAKHYAAICAKSGQEFVIVDGKKGQDYQFICDGNAFKNGELSFSPDSSKVSYIGNASGKYFLVTGDDESDAFDSTPSFRYVDDGKHLLTTGLRSQQAVMSIDAKATKRPTNSAPLIDSFVCIPGMSHFAFLAGYDSNVGSQIILDGKDTGYSGLFALNVDGSHFAVNGYHPIDNRSGLFVDNLLAYPLLQSITFHAFSPDGKHLYWMAVEPSKVPGAEPGAYDMVTYLDGKIVAHCERRAEAERIILPGGYVKSNKTSPAWDIQPDGSMVCMTVAGDSVKRLKVTPAADWNVDSWLAEIRKPAAGKRK